jgi:hypothetical protein
LLLLQRLNGLQLGCVLFSDHACADIIAHIANEMCAKIVQHIEKIKHLFQS